MFVTVSSTTALRCVRSTTHPSLPLFAAQLPRRVFFVREMNTSVINGGVGADGDGDTTTTTVPPNHEVGLSPINSTQFPIDSKVGWQRWHSSFVADVRDSAGETISSRPDLRNPSFDEEYAPLARRRTKVDLSCRSGEIDNSGVVRNETFPISSAQNDIPPPASPRAMKRKGSPPYDAGNFKYQSPSTAVLTPETEIADDFNSSRDHTSPIRYSTDKQDHSSLPTLFGKQGIPTSYQSCIIRQRTYHTHKRKLNGRRTGPSLSKNLPAAEPFDICHCEEMCESELFQQDVSSNMCELEHVEEDDATAVPRPGMVLLRSFLTETEQIHIVKKCRDIGMGPGGFYQPCFANGAKLRLQMMCLGLVWDPQTRKYSKRRQHDGSTPPPIPPELDALVRRAILNAHALIKVSSELRNAEEILPTMSPNICIVNFYNTTGRLGLHQDRDESRQSLRNALPVVSFSIGDSAEFLYGDTRDTEKAKRVILESGDVLIFGGESRHIFHGVKSIIPNSVPKFLLEESKLRPGRLNLTFRQY